MARALPRDEGHPRIIALLRMASGVGHELLFSRLEQAAGPLELRQAHFQLLRYPGPDGVRPTELARRVGSSKQVINPLVNDLEKWGYLRREPDPHDRRGTVLRLTERGGALLDTIRALHAEIEAEWEQRLGRTRYRALREALAEIATIDPSAPPDRQTSDGRSLTEGPRPRPPRSRAG
jgi:DNA-binding MarR family transcriptional regulator